MKYLDPKADLTFKKVFGEHPELVKSLLNALLPFKSKEEEITSVTYLILGMMPKTPIRKYRVLAVECEDAKGCQFIVEIQIIWSKEFMQRVSFADSKVYMRYPSLSEGNAFYKPVYSLNLVNEVFEPELDDYYHYYHLVHEEHADKVIDGLHLVFVELPKFKTHTFTEKKMQVLWLRYLTEIDEKTKEIPAELLANPEIAKAVSEIEESAYTEEELLGYDDFWDAVSVEKTLAGRLERLTKANDDAKEKLKATSSQLEATSSQLKEAEEQLKRANVEKLESAKKLLQAGVSTDIVASTLNLSMDEIEKLCKI